MKSEETPISPVGGAQHRVILWYPDPGSVYHTGWLTRKPSVVALLPGTPKYWYFTVVYTTTQPMPIPPPGMERNI